MEDYVNSDYKIQINNYKWNHKLWRYNQNATNVILIQTYIQHRKQLDELMLKRLMCANAIIDKSQCKNQTMEKDQSNESEVGVDMHNSVWLLIKFTSSP